MAFFTCYTIVLPSPNYNFVCFLIKNKITGAGVVAQSVKLSFSTVVYHIKVPVQVLSDLFLIQLPHKALGKAAEDGPNTWAPAPNVGD